jgi:DNA-binding NarL/FixJ family response regulator
MRSSAQLSVLVVDDMSLIRDSVKIILAQGKYAKVIGEAENGKEAIEMANYFKPDFILMDIDMPIMNGIEAAKAIHEKHTGTKIVMLTACTNEILIFTSFAAGADGYILKDKFQDTIEAAMTTVRLGSVWLDPAIARRILEIAASSAHTETEINIDELLTKEEREILNEVANCSGSRCLVDPEFITNLRRLAQIKYSQ